MRALDKQLKERYAKANNKADETFERLGITAELNNHRRLLNNYSIACKVQFYTYDSFRNGDGDITLF